MSHPYDPRACAAYGLRRPWGRRNGAYGRLRGRIALSRTPRTVERTARCEADGPP